jgi:hypothetical protein
MYGLRNPGASGFEAGERACFDSFLKSGFLCGITTGLCLAGYSAYRRFFTSNFFNTATLSEKGEGVKVPPFCPTGGRPKRLLCFKNGHNLSTALRTFNASYFLFFYKIFKMFFQEEKCIKNPTIKRCIIEGQKKQAEKYNDLVKRAYQ